jgi:hypothetical protein
MFYLTFCKKLRRLEVKSTNLAIQYCNGDIEENKFEFEMSKIEKKLDQLTNYKYKKIPISYNGDPRGYILKIDDEFCKKYQIDIEKDAGGYGLIAPNFNY